MPREYTRKVGIRPRAEWTEEALISALKEMSKGVLAINKIARKYGIPSRTLRRRFENQNTEKLTLGRHPILDFHNEKRLVMYIQKLERAAFTLSGDMIRRLAFEFAEKAGIETTFDKTTRMAGRHWFQSFIERNPILGSRPLKPTGENGLTREESNQTFDILLRMMTEFDLWDRPDKLYIEDDTYAQFHNVTVKLETLD